MTDFASAPRSPRIYVTAEDLARLQALAGDRAEAPGPRMLLDELDRAVVVTDAGARRFVRLGSLVSYEDRARGQTRTVRLVEPAEADVDAGRISVLTPVGAALIGMTEGAAILWTDERGRRHDLKVLAVDAAPSSGAAA